MVVINFLKEKYKILILISSICIILGVTLFFLFFKKEEKKDLLDIVNEFSETIENKEDPEKLLLKVEEFSSKIEEKTSEDLLKNVDNFSQNNN